jgi:TolB-like protein/Tfp pilus assembly protein PilF
MSLFSELQRRNVIRVAIAYAAASWLLIQVVETLFPVFGLSSALIRMVAISLFIGFPLILIFSWLYELTPEGLKLEKDVDRSDSVVHHTGGKLDRAIIVVLTLALGYFAFDKFVLDPARDARREESVARQARGDALVESYGDKSIAVLPFVNMSADADQEFFSDGISEELLHLLAGIPELRVISRSSAFLYKGKDIDIPTIAEQLNVAHILEGSVRRSGKRVRITAQLIDARSDTHLWSATYDRTLDDIFSTQDEIAAEVVEQLKLTLLGNNAPRVRQTDPAAYALFLQARHFRLQGTADAYEKAQQLYQEALGIDPDYPPAWEGLAEIYVFQALYGFRPVDESYRLAREAINKALAIDPQFGVGVAGLGWIAILYDHDTAAAARHFERAYMLNPTDLDVISGVAYLAESIGRMDAAIAFKEYAVARDPMGPVGHLDLAGIYLDAGRLEDAEVSIRIGLTLRPEHVGAHYRLGMASLLKGDALAALEAIEQETFDVYRLTLLAAAHYELSHQHESDGYLNDLIDNHATEAAYQVAGVYAWRAENDRAFEWLDKALQNNDQGLSAIVSNFWLKNLHDDSRWQPFLAKIGKSDVQLAAIKFDVRLPE